MIFYFLRAYDQKMLEAKNDLRLGFQKYSKLQRIFLYFIFFSEFLGIILMFYFQNNNSNITGVLMILIISSMYILTKWQGKNEKKNSIQRMQFYNKKLDVLKELLKNKNFNIHSKYQLKQLINKYNQYLSDHKKDFRPNIPIYTTIISVIGTIIVTALTNLDILGITLSNLMSILFILVLAIATYYIILSFYNTVRRDINSKMYDIVAELQDLLDRDWSIEENDLIL